MSLDAPDAPKPRQPLGPQPPHLLGAAAQNHKQQEFTLSRSWSRESKTKVSGHAPCAACHGGGWGVGTAPVPSLALSSSYGDTSPWTQGPSYDLI